MSSRKLSPAEMQAAKDWIKKYYPEGRCSICKEQKWKSSSRLFCLPEYSDEDCGVKQVLPCVVLICETCGHTVSFNAVLMGLLESDKDGS